MPKADSRARCSCGGCGEEGGIGGVGARPAALDVVDADAVQLARDRRLVGDAEVDTLRLRAVAQRRIVKVHAIASH